MIGTPRRGRATWSKRKYYRHWCGWPEDPSAPLVSPCAADVAASADFKSKEVIVH